MSGTELWELDVNTSPQKVLIYGDAKSGKTQLAATLAKKFTLHWFDLENGYKTLLKMPMNEKRNVNLFRVRDSYMDTAAINTCGKLADHFDSLRPVALQICVEHGKVACPNCKRDDAPFKTFDITKFTSNDIVVFDSLTQLTQSAYKFALKKADKNPANGDKAEFDQWGLQGMLLDRFLNAVQNAPCHVVVISHESAIEDNEGKEKLYPLAGTRNFTRTVGKYFDHIVRVYLSNKKHAAHSSTNSFNAAISGSRLDIDVTETLLPLFDVKSFNELSPNKFEVIEHEEQNNEISDKTASTDNDEGSSAGLSSGDQGKSDSDEVESSTDKPTKTKASSILRNRKLRR